LESIEQETKEATNVSGKKQNGFNLPLGKRYAEYRKRKIPSQFVYNSRKLM
jgi:hypothetical protein